MNIKNINPQYNIIHRRISGVANNKKISTVKKLELFQNKELHIFLCK